MYVPPYATESRTREPVPKPTGEPAAEELREPLVDVIRKIEDGPLRGAVRRIFADMTRLLEYLSLVEHDARQGSPLKNTLFTLSRVHRDARSLLDFIEEFAARPESPDDDFFQLLDSTGYALRHELTRVFEQELIGLNTVEDQAQARGMLAHSAGLLTNCFQQSVAAVARTFDPTISERSLFEDTQVRLQQSLALYDGLRLLIRLMRRAQHGQDRQAIVALVVELQKFRRGDMHFLMYRDWAEFERMVKLVMSTTSATELMTVLHRFLCYLETLLGHVKMRAVLTNYPLEADESDGH